VTTRAAHPGPVKSAGAGAPSSALLRWADHLVVEKKTTEDARYRAHREECIKALLEDRFCSQRKATPAERRESSSDKGNGHIPLGELRTPWGW
jgi:hypothetical protein